jgi:hypothetical protein
LSYQKFKSGCLCENLWLLTIDNSLKKLKYAKTFLNSTQAKYGPKTSGAE